MSSGGRVHSVSWIQTNVKVAHVFTPTRVGTTWEGTHVSVSMDGLAETVTSVSSDHTYTGVAELQYGIHHLNY